MKPQGPTFWWQLSGCGARRQTGRARIAAVRAVDDCERVVVLGCVVWGERALLVLLFAACFRCDGARAQTQHTAESPRPRTTKQHHGTPYVSVQR